MARTGELEIQVREARIRSTAAGRTMTQVSIIGPKELRICARRGAILFSYRGESQTIAERENYKVFLDPLEDDAEKKQPARKPSTSESLLAGCDRGRRRGGYRACVRCR
jgi:hypothetical protein